MELLWTDSGAASDELRSVLLEVLAASSPIMHGSVVVLVIVGTCGTEAYALVQRHVTEAIIFEGLHARHIVAVWHLLHVVVVAWVHGSAHHFPLICEVLNLFIMSSSLHVLQMILDHDCVASIVAFSFNFALSQLFLT